ncbi:NAD(P)H-dependent flavin oxidoreductase [Chloroflexota bacterium]
MKTRVTELLGIKHPIFQSAMGLVAEPPMVIASCNAGALGFLTPRDKTADQLRNAIRKIREAIGDKPFGVNMVPLQARYQEYVDIAVEERVPVIGHGAGDFSYLLGKAKAAGLKVIPSVGTVGQAIKAEKAGADAVIVSGWEAGGHCSYVASTVIIPATVAKVKIPVISAGGFADGKGLVAALALGAEAINMGTRFAITQESPIPDRVKQAYVQARAEMAVETKKVSGLHMRCILGKKAKKYRGWMFSPWTIIPATISEARSNDASIREIIGMGWRMWRKLHMHPLTFACGIYHGRKSLQGGDPDWFLPSGQCCGLINDIPTCKELIERIVAEAEQTIDSLKEKASG